MKRRGFLKSVAALLAAPAALAAVPKDDALTPITINSNDCIAYGWVGNGDEYVEFKKGDIITFTSHNSAAANYTITGIYSEQ